MALHVSFHEVFGKAGWRGTIGQLLSEILL
jgi:hypothetical protein